MDAVQGSVAGLPEAEFNTTEQVLTAIADDQDFSSNQQLAINSSKSLASAYITTEEDTEVGRKADQATTYTKIQVSIEIEMRAT